MEGYHLMRVHYPTDIAADEPDYQGMFSDTIPETALRDWSIVGVDWSQRGVVEVTFLIPYPRIQVG